MEKNEQTMIITDPEYKQWVSDICARFRRQQVKAAIHVNREKIEFYWELGRDICERQIEKRYGDAAIKTLSNDLRNLLPDSAGLSPGGLYYCKRFYLLYSRVFEKFPQVGEISSGEDLTCKKEVLQKVPQVGEKFKPLHTVSTACLFPLNIFAVPWNHHKVIIDRFENEPQKALFYVRKTLEHSWSRAMLLNMMGDKGKNNGLYEREGKTVNNFPATLPLPSGDLARELFTDPMNLSFVELKASYDENTLKQALVRHVNELLMALGSGFAYMGREYLLSVVGKEQFSDLLFYNTRMHAYVVVEVKVTEFESAFLGQLSGYISLVNHILKTEMDGKTIGLLICRSKNNVYAQYCLEGYNHPIAITAYEGIRILPDNFNDALPSIEQLEAEIVK